MLSSHRLVSSLSVPKLWARLVTQQLVIHSLGQRKNLPGLKNSPMSVRILCAVGSGVSTSLPMPGDEREQQFPSPSDFARLVQSLTHCILIHDADTKDILWANQRGPATCSASRRELKPLKAPDMSSAGPALPAVSRRRQWLQDAADHGTQPYRMVLSLQERAVIFSPRPLRSGSTSQTAP